MSERGYVIEVDRQGRRFRVPVGSDGMKYYVDAVPVGEEEPDPLEEYIKSITEDLPIPAWTKDGQPANAAAREIAAANKKK